MTTTHPLPTSRRATRRFAWTVAWVLVGALVGVTSAGAQTVLDVERALTTTDAVIERARTSLACGPGDERLPCLYLRQAAELQASARSSFAAGFLRDALGLTLRARDRAYSALRLAQDATRGEFVRFMIERTDALLDRIAPMVRETRNEQALRLLDAAFEMQRRAKELAAGGRPRAALSATVQARELALRALRLAEGRVGSNGERARRVLERTDELLRDAAWLAGSGASAREYEAALRIQAQAQARWDAGQAGAAVDLSLKARDRLGRAFAKAERAPDRGAVEAALRANAEALAEARVRGSNDPEKVRLLERAEAHHRRAQALYEQGRVPQAMAELRTSQELVARSRR